MKDILQEGVSKIVYHFTTLEALKNIIATNRINFSNAKANQIDMACQPEGYNYYLSVTRQSSPLVGYPGMKNTGNKDISSEINEALTKYRKTRTRQIDQFGIDPWVRRRTYQQYDKNAPDSELTDKQLLSKRTDKLVKPTAKFVNNKGNTVYALDKNQSSNRNKISQNSETEERIFSKTKYFENVYDYILRIDILPSQKKLNVRICLDGNKVNQNYLAGPVDYIYNKYITGVKYSTLAETRKPKGKLLSNDDWQLLKDCFALIQTKKQTGKDSFETRNLYWGNKIFLHLSSRTINLGTPMLQKYLGDDIVTDKDLKKMIKNNVVVKKGRKPKELPTLIPSKIKLLLKFIFVLTPPCSKLEKTKLCKEFCKKYFSNITVVFKNKQYKLSSLLPKYLKTANDFWDMWKNSTMDKVKFNLTSQYIAGAYKDFNGPLSVIYERIEKMFNDFLQANGLQKLGQIVTKQWNKYYEKTPPSKRSRKPKQNIITVTEDEIKEMVCETLKRII